MSAAAPAGTTAGSIAPTELSWIELIWSTSPERAQSGVCRLLRLLHRPVRTSCMQKVGTCLPFVSLSNRRTHLHSLVSKDQNESNIPTLPRLLKSSGTTVAMGNKAVACCPQPTC